MIYRHLVAILCAALSATSACAAGAGELEAANPSSPVRVDGKTVFRLRTPGIWASSEERATQVSGRIRRALQDRSLRNLEVSTAEGETGTTTNVLLGETILVSVSDDDARAENRGRQGLAHFYALELQRAITSHRQLFAPRRLAVDLLLLVLATAAFIGLLKGMAAVFPRVYRTIDALEHMPKLWGVLTEASRVRLARDLLRTLARESRLALVIVLTYAYVTACLRLLPWTKEYYYQFSAYVLAPVVNTGLAIWHYLPNLAVLAAIALATRYVLQAIRLLADELARRPDAAGVFHPEWARPTYKLVRFVAIAFAVVMAFPYLPGAQSPAFKGVSIFIGVLVSLGSTSAVANLAAGVILVYSRSFRIGDWVRIGETVGEVVEATLLVTRLRTAKNIRVTIPNGTVMAQSIENYSVPGQGRAVILSTAVTIGYDVPWRRVEELLLKAAQATDGILLDPAPFVLQTTLDDFYVRHELGVFTATPRLTAPTLSALHRRILDVFNEAGVEILSPHYAQVRDGNHVAIPAQYVPADYAAPGLRLDCHLTPRAGEGLAGRAGEPAARSAPSGASRQ